jgi:hypothetical protein
MLVRKILDHFDAYTKLHIDVTDVRDQLVDSGVVDTIIFHFVKMDSAKIRGILHRYEMQPAPYGDFIPCADIIISDEMEDDWQRLVAVKELLHLADNGNFSASTQNAVDVIFHNFSIPPELRHDARNGEVVTKSFQNDKLCILLALAILIPCECREILRDLYARNKLSAREIAGIARIPARYVDTVMASDFDSKINLLLDWDEIHADADATNGLAGQS